jgi:hypothetical protein
VPYTFCYTSRYTSTRGGRAWSESLRNRFEAKVDRSGEHHVWTGSRTSDGAGKLKVDDQTVSARRVAWELARGALAVGVVVKACPDDQSVSAGRAPRLAWRIPLGQSAASSSGHGIEDRDPARACGSSRSRPVATSMGGCAGCIAPCRPTPKPRRRGSLRPSPPRVRRDPLPQRRQDRDVGGAVITRRRRPSTMSPRRHRWSRRDRLISDQVHIQETNTPVVDEFCCAGRTGDGTKPQASACTGTRRDNQEGSPIHSF